jgi:hypothetical protein
MSRVSVADQWASLACVRLMFICACRVCVPCGLVDPFVRMRVRSDARLRLAHRAHLVRHRRVTVLGRQRPCLLDEHVRELHAIRRAALLVSRPTSHPS